MFTKHKENFAAPYSQWDCIAAHGDRWQPSTHEGPVYSYTWRYGDRLQPCIHKGPEWLDIAQCIPCAASYTQRACMAAHGHIETVCSLAYTKDLLSCTWGPFAAPHPKRACIAALGVRLLPCTHKKNCLAALGNRLLHRTQKGPV